MEGFCARSIHSVDSKNKCRFYKRYFSISSSLEQFKKEKTITLTIQKQADGKVTPWLINHLAIGTSVGISDAMGDFTLQNKSDNLLFLAGGSGITPFISMLHQSKEQGKNATLLYYCKTDKHLFRNALSILNDENIKVVCIATDKEGRISNAHLEKYCSDYLNRAILICGPEAMIEQSQKVLLESNADTTSISFEYFKKKLKSFDTTEKILSKIQLKNKLFEADNTTTILTQLEAHKINPKFGCRMGLCKQCTCTKESGVVYNVLTQKYSEDTKEDIQICVSIPIGDIKLNL